MITNSWLRITAWAAGLVAAAAAFFIISVTYKPVIEPILSVLLPFSVAVAIALLLDPTLSRLEQRGLPRGLSTVIVALLFLAVVAILAVFIVPAVARQASELAQNLPTYYKDAQTYLSDFATSHEGLLRRLHLPTTATAITAEITSRAQAAIMRSFSSVGTVLGGLVGKAVWLVMIPIITLFLLADIRRIKGKALLTVPARHRQRTAELACSIGRVFGSYIRGLLSVAFLYGIACGIALMIWGVPYAVLLGAAAGVLSLVPYIGTISTLLIVTLIALVSNIAHPMTALWVALTILILNQVFDNAVSPKIVGKAVGIHPAIAILALLIGGQMFGLIGMVLSVPIAASIQLLILEFYPPLRGDPEQEEEQKPPLMSRLWHRFVGQRREQPATVDAEGDSL